MSGGSPAPGFALLEALIVVALVAIVANLAVPAARYAALRGQATTILADFEAISSAAAIRRRATGSWPSDRPAGHSLVELVPLMERAVAFHQRGWTYDWNAWVDAEGRPTRPGTGVAVGLGVLTDDAGLVELLRRRAPGPVVTLPGWGAILVVEGAGG